MAGASMVVVPGCSGLAVGAERGAGAPLLVAMARHCLHKLPTSLVPLPLPLCTQDSKPPSPNVCPRRPSTIAGARAPKIRI